MSGQDLKKSGITTKMISPGRTYKVWASILIVGLALICLIGFLIGAFYQSQVKLQKSNLERFRYDLERVAAAINYFWSERINDLKQLATSRELYIFFSNKALGMSMEYGLKASLIQIGQLFDRMIHAKRLDDSQIYLRILFQDRAARPLVVKGKRYQDLGAKGSWSGVFSSSTLTPQIVISKENEEWQVLIGVPCLFKGQYEGHVLAWVDGQRVFHKLVTKKLSKEGTFFLSAKLNGKAIPIEATGVAVSQLASKLTSLQPGKVFYFDFPGFRNQKKVTEMLALGVPVAGSPFTFYALVPKADVLGAQPPWHLVTGLIITSSLLVVGLGILLWFNHQTTLLQARLSEEAIRSKELQAEIAIRKQTERALRASEERYRHIVDNATEIIYETDVEGRFTFFNPMATQLTCYTAKELRTKRFLDLVRPDLAQEVEQFYRRQYIERILKTYYEFPILTKFGEELWLGQNVRLVTEADKIIGFRAVARDITESKHSRDTLQQSHDDLEERVRRRTAELEAANKVLSREIEERKRVEAALRESEERYHRILEASPDPIVLYDMEGKVIYVNPAFSRIFGWTLEEVIGKKLDFVPEEAWPETLKRLEQLKRGESFFGFETSRYTKKGEIVEVNISAAVWRGKDGTLSGSIVNLRDITEQKKMEAQLRHAQKMEAVGTLAGGIAHDFNNVLQAVSGYVQLLMMKKSPGDPELKYLAGIDQSVQRAEGLIRQLLTVSRRLESYLEPVDLNHEIIQVTQLLERTIPKMIDIELHLAGDLCMVNADPTQLEQIILNLANNAKDAMPDGGQLTFETQNIVVDETYSQTHPGLEPGQYLSLIHI